MYNRLQMVCWMQKILSWQPPRLHLLHGCALLGFKQSSVRFPRWWCCSQDPRPRILLKKTYLLRQPMLFHFLWNILSSPRGAFVFGWPLELYWNYWFWYLVYRSLTRYDPPESRRCVESCFRAQRNISITQIFTTDKMPHWVEFASLDDRVSCRWYQILPTLVRGIPTHICRILSYSWCGY